MLGWECPKCGRCYSPSMTMCCYCNPLNYKTTSIPFSPSGTVTVNWITCPRCNRGHFLDQYHVCVTPPTNLDVGLQRG